jgi:hypothetical protein
MITSDIKYLEDLDCETENREYKLFTLPVGFCGLSDGFDVLKTGLWKFDEWTIKTLKSYISNYFPKYLSSFTHPKTLVTNACLHIGVDDDGIVHGIPYGGILTEDIIWEYVKLTTSKIRCVNHTKFIDSDKSESTGNYVCTCDCLEKYMEKVKISVTKINTQNYKVDIKNYGLDSDYSELMWEKIKKKEKKQKEIHKRFIRKKRNWEKFSKSYNHKITDIINSKWGRKEIIDLIRSTSTSTTKLDPKFRNIYGYCEIPYDYWTIVSELKTRVNFPKINFSVAEAHRNIILSPIYWGLKYRDLKTPCKKILSSSNSFQILKPQPEKPKYNFSQYSLLVSSQIPKMIPSWIKRNPSLNLYVVSIQFPDIFSKDLPNTYFEYNDKSNTWIRSFRTSFCGEPICQPII